MSETQRGADDGPVRAEVLDVSRSFIVEAPAGSGKTGLLTQRVLALLATVDQPEEVLAITFTRRATAEMRERIVRALEAAERSAPEAAHEAATWRLAAAVRARDRRLGWHLVRNPARLQVLTIDGLCAALVRRMPWTSRLGSEVGLVEDAAPLYREAARETLALLEDDEWGEPLATLLAHLQNDAGRFERLVVEMLGRRDQWLRLLQAGARSSEAARSMLEAVIARSVRGALEAVRAAIPAALRDELVAVAAFAGTNLAGRDPGHEGAICAELDSLPVAEAEQLGAWCGIAGLLLRKDGEWRATLRVSEGFPPKDAEAASFKERALALVDRLGQVAGLREALDAVRRLPPIAYSDAQWATLDALISVLRLSAGMLRVVFSQRGRSDFIELSAAAGAALGEPERPTDLALALDHRVRHILVDEFQDTSHTHYGLLEQLVAGWSPGDGRSLFAVGDPMQSIYRFREADVGLFLHAAAHGVGDVALEHRRLTRNFRSRPALIEWVNASFPDAFPPVDGASDGAVAYRPAFAARETEPGSGVQVEVFTADREAEARWVVDTIIRTLAEEPDGTVALLVRSRSHLQAILPRLDAAGVGWRGVDLAPLSAVPAVVDLMALTRAALHRADRVAWLAALRAPWCGFTLDDLHRLCGHARRATIPALIADRASEARLSPDGARRLQRVRAPLLGLLERAEGGRLADVVQRAWYAVGGPATIAPAAVPDVRTYFDVLARLDDEIDAPDARSLVEHVARHNSSPAIEDARVEIMTVHRAKGLEFDTVIVPSLDRPPPPDRRRLLIWSQSAPDIDGVDLVLAPIPDVREEQRPLYDFVRRREADKQRLEIARLLYVAATRARERLHLGVCAPVPPEGGTPPAPHAGSLAAPIWPVLSAHTGGAGGTPDAQAVTTTTALALRRLPGGWQPPTLPADLDWTPVLGSPAVSPGEGPVEFDWAGPAARYLGTVVHRILHGLAGRDPLPDAAWIAGQRPGWRRALAGLGMPDHELDGATDRAEAAVAAVLADERGRWLLAPHREHAAELELSGVLDGELVRVVIDRTFVDEAGTRWIVDYKTGRHEGGRRAEFLSRERERYRGQLDGYARLLAHGEDRPCRLGLYFPLMAAFSDWAAGD